MLEYLKDNSLFEKKGAFKKKLNEKERANQRLLVVLKTFVLAEEVVMMRWVKAFLAVLQHMTA